MGPPLDIASIQWDWDAQGKDGKNKCRSNRPLRGQGS
jgi:hypothetical protein